MNLLSDHAKHQLRLLGLARSVDVRLCSKCGLSSEQLPKGPHPLLTKIIQVRRLLERDRKNLPLSRQVNTLVSQMHYSSRCCQARMKTVQKDAFQPLWETWLERETRVPDLDIIRVVTNPNLAVSERQKQQFRQKLQANKPKTRITNDVPILAPERENHRDPDFRRMAFLLGTDGTIVRGIIKIFREEEARQARAQIAIAV